METPTLGLAFIAGILSFVSPCVLPLVPAYISYMSGRMTNTVAAQVALAGAGGRTVVSSSLASRFSTVLHGLFFIAGFTVVFVIVGMVTTILLGPVRELIGRIGGVVIIFFGLHFMGVMPRLFNWLQSNRRVLRSALITPVMLLLGSGLILWGITGMLFPPLTAIQVTTTGETSQIQVGTVAALVLLAGYVLWLVLGGAFVRPESFWGKLISTLQTALYADTRRQIAADGRQGYLGSAFMGVVFAAGWTPCIGPILGSILGLAASASGGSALTAGGLLMAYSLGLGIPFLLAALMLDSIQGVFRRLQRHMHKIELVTGGLLVLIGFLVASGQLQSFSQQMTIQFGELSLRVEDCGLGAITGEIGLQHLGPCLNGETRLIEVGNTVQNKFTQGKDTLRYIFHAKQGDILDVQLQDRSGGLDPLLILSDGNQLELGRSVPFTSATGNPGALIDHVAIPMDGVYTLVVTQQNRAIQEGTFTIRVSMSEQREVTSTGAALSGTIGEAVVGLEIGNMAPEFVSQTVEGEAVSLAGYRGKVVILNFWATWCGPCRVEMPEFQAAYEQLSEKDFVVVAVNFGETAATIKAFQNELGLTFPLVMDERGDIQEQFGVFSYPTTFVLNPQGIITEKIVGPMTASQVETLVNKALS